MQIVIEIPDSYYKILVNPYQYNEKLCEELKGIVRKGTPLPKGHGRLIDADKIGLTDFEWLSCNEDYKEALKILDDKIKNAVAIIPAD